MHPFDQAIALDAIGDGVSRGHTSELYWNFVSPYGGVTAAVLLNAILQNPARIGDPLTLTVNYAAPIKKGPVHRGGAPGALDPHYAALAR